MRTLKTITFALVCFSYILIRANSMADAGYIITHLFTGWATFPSSSYAHFLLNRSPELLLSLYGSGMVFLVELMQRRGPLRPKIAAQRPLVRWCLYYAAALSIVVLGAFYNDAQQFIYFQF